MLNVEREDRPAYVRFERRPIEDKAASLKAGHVVCKDVDYALVTPPYSKDCVEYKVETWLTNMEQNVRKGRIPSEWMKQWKEAYKAWKDGQEAPVNGTDVRNWSAVTPAQVKNLVAAGCYTVEDLAAANDQALRYIGMGANELKRKANAYLQASKDIGPVVMMNNALETENEQLKGTIDSLQKQIENLSRQVQGLQGQRMDFTELDDEKPDNVIDINEITDDIDENETLRELYREKFGKNPHPQAKIETLKRSLGL